MRSRTALVAMAVAFVLGTVIVVIDNAFPKLKPYTPSPTALGIALTTPAYQGLGMFFGALIAWIPGKEGSQVARDVYHSRCLRLYRRREHHGRDNWPVYRGAERLGLT